MTKKQKVKDSSRTKLEHRRRSLSEMCFRICATRKRRVIFSVVSAFALFWLCYFMDNCEPIAALDRTDICYVIEKTLPQKSRSSDDNVFFVNTSRNRQLVDLHSSLDTNLYQVGNTDITDRKMLLDFLNMLDTVEYKFLIIDLTFDKRHKTEYDKALFDKLLEMKNVIIADKIDTVNCYEIADKRLRKIARFTDYHTYFANSSLSRYQFLQRKKPSLPLEIAFQLWGKEIHKVSFLPICYTKGHLCMNAPKICIDGRFEDGKLKIDRNYCGDLGFSFVNDTVNGTRRVLNADLNDKYVIVTDVDNDVHDTYMGKVPGGYIIYEALKFLQNDHHVLKWWHVLMTILVFSFVLLFLFWTHYGVKKKTSSKASAFRNWLFTNGILYLYYLVIFLVFSYVCNIVIPMTYITIVAIIISKSKQYEKSLSDSNYDAVA